MILGLLLAALAGCEKNPARPEPVKPLETVSVTTSDTLSVSNSDSLSTVIVTFVDETGKYTFKENRFSNSVYLINFIITPEYSFETPYKFEVENPTVVIDSVHPGSYSLGCDFFLENILYPETNRDFELKIRIVRTVVVQPNQTFETHIILPKELSLPVYIENDKNEPLTGVEVGTVPESVTAITDSEGRAVLKNLLLGYKSITVKRYDLIKSVDSFHLPLKHKYGDLEEIIIDTGNRVDQLLLFPATKIISPGDNYYGSNRIIRFTGDGYDMEDDLLPEESLEVL
ncbi:hypothetical protein ACFL6P_05365 [Candidatus Latescibacterota bacterium]